MWDIKEERTYHFNIKQMKLPTKVSTRCVLWRHNCKSNRTISLFLCLNKKGLAKPFQNITFLQQWWRWKHIRDINSSHIKEINKWNDVFCIKRSKPLLPSVFVCKTCCRSVPFCLCFLSKITSSENFWCWDDIWSRKRFICQHFHLNPIIIFQPLFSINH